eukprot:jgi/Pico_ML_1/53535/g4067.t1
MPSAELGDKAEKLWEEVKPVAFEVLKEVLHTACLRAKGLRLPTIHGVTETAVGKVAFYLTRMAISELKQDLDSVKLERMEGKENNHFQLVLSDVFVSITGFRWQFQQLGVPWLDGKGEANVTVRKVEIKFFFSYEASNKGMEVTMEGAALNVPKVNLVLKEDAGPSWLYSFLTSVLNDKLRNVLQKELNEVICKLAVRLSDRIGLMSDGVLALHLSPAVLELAAAIDPTVFDNEPVIATNGGQVHLLGEGISFLHFSAAKHSPKVVLFSSQSHIPNLYLQLANEYGKELTFGFVSCVESSLREYFGVKQAPLLVVFPQFGSCAPPSVYRGELTINPLRRFLSQFCFKPGHDMLKIEGAPAVAAYQTPGARKRFFSRTSSHLLEESGFSSQDSDKHMKRVQSEGTMEPSASCIKLEVPPLPAGVPFSNYVIEKERLFGSALTPETLHAFCTRSLKLQK